MNSLNDYTKPTLFCDFDQSPELVETARELTKQLSEEQEIFDSIYRFVKEL